MEKHPGPIKLRGRDADDSKRMFVQLDDAADNASIILKTSVPIRIAEHDIWSAMGAMLIGGMNEPAEIRLKA